MDAADLARDVPLPGPASPGAGCGGEAGAGAAAGTGLLIFVAEEEREETYPVDVAPDATVRDVKRAVAAAGGLPADVLRLRWHGETLRDATLLADAGVGAEAVLQVPVNLGKRVGPWLLFSTLWRGFGSKRKRAVHRFTYGRGEARIVVKTPELIRSPGSSGLMGELRAIERVSPHPHVARICEKMQTHRHIYLIYEELDTCTLASRMRCLPEDEARGIAHQLLLALQHCHARRVAHNNVQPDSVRFGADGKVRLSGFGSVLFDRNSTSPPCRHPYAAPEVQLGHQPTYSQLTRDKIMKADVWSAGMVIHQMLCGRMVSAASLGADWAPDKAIGAAPAALLRRMLAADVEQRCTSAEAAGDRWFHPNGSDAADRARAVPLPA